MSQKIKYLFSISFASILLLAILEFGLSICLKNPQFIPNFVLPIFKDYYFHHDRRMVQLLPNSSVYNSSLFYTLKPGRFTFYNREFSNIYNVNSKGMRDKEVNIKNPKILFLGDSFTMGWGVEDNEIFTSLVASQLNKSSLNTGISSYGTARETISSKPYITDSLEYLVIQFCFNDYEENSNYVKNNFELKISSESVFNREQNNHLENIEYKPFKYLFGIAYFIKHRLKYFITNKPLPEIKLEHNAGQLFLDIIQNMKLPKNVKIIVFSLDINKTTSEFSTQIEQLKQSNNLENYSVIDFSDKIKQEHFFKLDGHLNAAGHQVVANEISKLIKSLL